MSTHSVVAVCIHSEAVELNVEWRDSWHLSNENNINYRGVIKTISWLYLIFLSFVPFMWTNERSLCFMLSWTEHFHWKPQRQFLAYDAYVIINKDFLMLFSWDLDEDDWWHDVSYLMMENFLHHEKLTSQRFVFKIFISKFSKYCISTVVSHQINMIRHEANTDKTFLWKEKHWY